MSIQAHADAILTLLRADADLTVYPRPDGPGDGTLVPAGAEPPYVAVHIHREYGPSEDLGGDTSRVVVRAILHCVGANDIAARAVSQRVADVLLDARVVIAGRATFPIRHESSVPPREDESTGRRVVDLTETYRLESLPA